MKYFLSRIANRNTFHEDIISHYFSKSKLYEFKSRNIITDDDRHLNNRAYLISVLVTIIAI